MTPLKPYLIRALHKWIIDNGLTPYILVDAKFEGVDVPDSFVTDDRIILNTHPDAIQNWVLEDEAISFSARFSGQPESLFIPINAVLATYAKENGKGMMFDERFEDDVPPEPNDPKSEIKKQKPVLKIVK
ncbi:MAG: ClpXP protease specificity-enhancing factor [Cycloclasticus sp.]|nr:MAG: ClpXP protease specificity-enhancing factor [Cycloclasticus sp.]